MAAVVAVAPSLDARVPGLHWSAAEVMAHLTAQAVRYREFAKGERRCDEDVAPPATRTHERVAAVNDALVRQFLEPRPAAAAAGLRAAVDRLVTELAEVDPAQPLEAWEATTDVGMAATTLLSELVVHGSDLGRAFGIRDSVHPERAALAMYAVVHLLRAYVRTERLPLAPVTVRLLVRGGPRVELTAGSGGIRLRGESSQQVDTTVRARPGPMLLLAHGRMPLWRAAASGGLVVTGRRADVALRLLGWFDRP